MDLNLCCVFIDIAEAGSLTGAAQHSGMTRSNVLRRLKARETEMGAQLLRRSTRNVELTQAGRLLYRRCLAMMEELQRAATPSTSCAPPSAARSACACPRASGTSTSSR